MKIFNKTSFDLIAFRWDTNYGYGGDVLIKSGQSTDLNGPCLGDMGGCSCRVYIDGEIVCQETPDDEKGFQITPGNQLNLKLDDKGITVRHFSEDRIIKK